MDRTPSERRRTAWLPLLWLAVTSAGVFLWQNARVKVLSDFSYIIENANRIALGDVPYRDFVIPQAPLTFLLHAAIIRLLPGGLLVSMLVCALEAGATTVLTCLIVSCAQRTATRPSSLPAVLLAAPVVFLNGYAIIAMPFYDCDAMLFVLLALWAILRARERRDDGWRSAAAGALLVLPIFTKQNIGLAAFAATHATLFVSTLGDPDPRMRRGYAWLAGGSIAALAAVLVVIQRVVGLDTYFSWTITYAAARRWPRAGLLLSLYGGRRTWLFAAAMIAGYALVRRGGMRHPTRNRPSSFRYRWTTLIGLAILGLPLVEAAPTMIRWGLAARADMLWGGVVIVILLDAAATVARGAVRFEAMLPLLAVVIAHGAFASQGVFDSAYAVWPLLLIAAAPLAMKLVEAAGDDRSLARTCVAACAMVLTALGARHVARAERLQFADVSGRVEHATLPKLRGLATGGTYISDFERLVRRTELLIPFDDRVALVPGEDPFFFATGRRPALPVVWFDDTAIPYDTAMLMRLLDQRDIKWVIVKSELQLHNRAWAPIETFVNHDLPTRYHVVERLPRYAILKRID